MTEVYLLGKNPTSFQAALLLARNKAVPKVYGEEWQGMPEGDIKSYLGIQDRPGEIFQSMFNQQMNNSNVETRSEKITGVEDIGEIWKLTDDEGKEFFAPYLIITSREYLELAEEIGLEVEDDKIEVDRLGRTGKEKIYAGGPVTRDDQLLPILAGDGGVLASQILKENGFDCSGLIAVEDNQEDTQVKNQGN